MLIKNKFDKAKALSGSKVVNRKGVEVSNIRNQQSMFSDFTLLGDVVEEGNTIETTMSWNSDGRYLNSNKDSQFDLLMG
jgi:hypothetical protein